MRTSVPLAILCCVLTVAPAALAGTTGKIAGTVRNAATKEPILAAAVQVEGTRFGGVADENGTFFILNLTPGDYSLTAHALGFQDITITGVHVTADFTTSVQFALEATVAATTEPITVEGKRPLIQRDATATTRVLTAEEIENSPTRGYLGIVAQNTGVVKFSNFNSQQVGGPVTSAVERTNTPVLIFRGGRPDEVGYYVDGFSQQDLLSGLTTATVPNGALSEIVVQPGGFSAEYGRNLSGIVNIVTKEGGDRLSGSVEVVTDNISGSWIDTGRYDQNIYAASLGGPLFGRGMGWTFHAAVERGWMRDQSPSPVRIDEDERLPNNSNGTWLWNSKVSGRLSPGLQLRLGTTGSVQDWREFRTDYLFDLVHAPRYRDRNVTANAQLVHTIDRRTFQTLAVGFFSTRRQRGDGLFFDDLSAYGAYGGDGNSTFNSTEGLFFYGPEDPVRAHIYDDFLDRRSSYVEFKWDLSRQMNAQNLVKVGVDVQRHTLRFYEHLRPTENYPGAQNPFIDVQSYGFDSTGAEKDDSGLGLNDTKQPLGVGVYLQDKIELERLVIQPGVRYDYFDSNTERVIDESDPLDESSRLGPDRLTESEPKRTWSPRLGIAFPVDEKTHFHINYGKFYQQPSLKELYTNYSYLAYKIRTGGYYYAFGNPNLEPERTTAYEIGATRVLGAAAKIDVSAYYKDIRGLSQVTTIPSSPSGFSSFRNRDFGTARGLDVFLSTARVRRFAGNVNYSLSYAEGTGSISQTQRNVAWTASEPPKQTAPLAFDQRHKLSVSLDYRYGENDGPAFRGGRPLSKTGLNLLFNAASGLPYTPVVTYNEVTLNAVSTTPAGPINSRYGPWTYQLDLKLDREFNTGFTRVSAYVWVVNLLDRKNPVNVYGSSGLPDNTGWLSTPEGQAWLATNGEEARERYELAQSDPRNFATPRVVRVGLMTTF